jgi:beta-N-acetylhexosaminidase
MEVCLLMNDIEWLRHRIGQLVCFGFDGQTVPSHVKDLITTHHVGNIILFSRNIATTEQLIQLNQDLQTLSKGSGHELPLTISVDQENGVVRRLPKDIPGLPGNMALGATGNPQWALQSGQLTAQLLRHVGINFNLAPVLDVNNNADNPVIGVRSFGDRPDMVATFGVKFIQGLQSQGVIACGKHFPGHGDTTVDSHLQLPTIHHDRQRLERVELMPFKKAIEAGVDALMTAHIVFPAIEPQPIPATLSGRVLTELLRQELGFEGLIITDCLEMNAVADTVGVGAGAVMALQARADLGLVSHRLDLQLEVIAAILDAVKTGTLSEERLENAYERVSALKKARLTPNRSVHPWEQLVGETRRLQRDLAEHAVTKLRWDSPIPPAVRRVAILVDDRIPVMVAAGENSSTSLLEDALAAVRPDVQRSIFRFPSTLQETRSETLLAQLRDYDLVLIGINGAENQDYLEVVRRVHAQAISNATLLLRSPYDARLVPQSKNLVALYENTPWMAKAAVAAIFGGFAQGTLPVSIPGAVPR